MLEIEQLLKMKEAKKPYSEDLYIEPGLSGFVINREIILGATSNKSYQSNLLVCHPDFLVVFRDDLSRQQGIRYNPGQHTHPIDLAIEYSYRGDHVYIADQYEIVPHDNVMFYAHYQLLSAKPIEAIWVSGKIPFTTRLANLGRDTKSL